MWKQVEAGRDVKVILWNIQMGRKGIGEIQKGSRKTGWELRLKVGLQVVFTEAVPEMNCAGCC